MSFLESNPNRVLSFVVNKIIEAFPDKYSRNNCRAVAVPMVVPQNGFKYVHVYYSGSSFEMGEGDANLIRRMSFGIRVHARLSSHELNQVEETSKALIDMAYEIAGVVHGTYELVEAPFDEAPILENEAPIRAAETDGSFLMYIDQTYKCHLHSTWSEMKNG